MDNGGHFDLILRRHLCENTDTISINFIKDMAFGGYILHLMLHVCSSTDLV